MEMIVGILVWCQLLYDRANPLQKLLQEATTMKTKRSSDAANGDFGVLSNLRHDSPAGMVVFLVAVPLCLGIALASGAPLFSGLIASIIGGLLVPLLSRSALGVSGPGCGSRSDRAGGHPGARLQGFSAGRGGGRHLSDTQGITVDLAPPCSHTKKLSRNPAPYTAVVSSPKSGLAKTQQSSPFPVTRR